MAELYPDAQEVVLCEECNERSAQHHCLTCVGHLCGPCKDAHEQRKISSSHRIVPFTSDLPVYGQCIDHPKNKYEVFCKSCDIPVCIKCIMEIHNGHEFEEIQDTYCRKRKYIMQQISNIDNIIIPKKEKQLCSKRCELEMMTKATETLKVELKEQCQKLFVKIKSILETNLKVIDNIKNVEMKDIKNQEENIEREIEECKQTKCELHEILDKRITTDFLISSKGISHFNLKEGNYVSYTLPKFVPSCLNNITSEGHFGIVILPLIKDTIPRLMENLEEVETIDTSSKSQFGVQCVDQSSILLRNEEVILKCLGTKFGTLHKHLQGLVCTRRPNGICIDRNSVLYGDLENGQISRIIRTDWFPAGVHVTKSGDILVGLYEDKYGNKRAKIAKYSANGKLILVISEEVCLFKRPAYLTENVNLDICVTDKKRQQVIVVDNLGKFKFFYDGKSAGNTPCLFYPREIDTDSLGNIVVADEVNNSLHVISINGILLKHLRPRVTSLNSPIGLSIDAEDKIWIAESTSGKIKIFKHLL